MAEKQGLPGPLKRLATLVVVAGLFTLGILLYPKLWRAPTPELPPGGTVAESGDSAPPVVPQPIPSRVKFPDEECQRLLELKNLGVGYLENSELSKAEGPLAELAARLPEEPAGVRNLAILRVLILEAEQAPRDAYEKFLAAIEPLKKLEPDSPVPLILSARAAMWQRSKDVEHSAELEAQAVADLVRALDLVPDDPGVWFELYEAARISQSDMVKAHAAPAIRRAHDLAPDNLAIMLRWLRVQADEHDPAIAQTLEILRQLIAPQAEGIAIAGKRSPDQLKDHALTAIGEGKWDKVMSIEAAGGLINIVNSDEWTKSDLRRVQRHPLAYVVRDFRPGLCDPPADAQAVAAFDVRFQAVPPEQQLPSLPGVRDVLTAEFDRDGRWDVIALASDGIHVFGRPDATQPWAAISRLELPAVNGVWREATRGLLGADLDRDTPPAGHTEPSRARQGEAVPTDADQCQEADIDLVVWGAEGAIVLRNQLDSETGTRSLIPVKQPPKFQAVRDILTGVLIDFDHDGDLDLVFSTTQGLSLWSSRGDMTFDDVTGRSTLPPMELQATALVAVDWDRDLDMDVIVSGPDSQPAGFLENLRHAQFIWRPFEGMLAGLAGSDGLALVDPDGNLSWDLAGCNFRGLRFVRSRTLEPGRVDDLDVLDLTGVGSKPASRILVWDLDNDSYFDLVAWGSAGLVLYRGTAAGGFEPLRHGMDALPATVGACAVGDMDHDGDGDLIVATPDGLVLLDNDGGNKNHWLDVTIRGETDDKSGRVNHFGIGSLIEVKAGSFYREQVVAGQVTHFGLGSRDKLDLMRVTWTNGVPQPAVEPRPDQHLCEKHSLKGSCPYLYAWNGDRFAFCTDTCWAAPLGLQQAEGVYAQPRAWEYLLIRGDRLQPRDGHYVLQMTEELWEAAYFDRIQLLTVDHPADVAVYSNEKVGPGDLAEFKVHTVRHPRLPVAASDQRGRDWLETIRQEDGQFTRCFNRNLTQGLTDEHWLELDLGSLRDPEQVTLFLTGWVYPTDTSLNVANSQNPGLPASLPPALWAPDAGGQWREVQPYMGFPGGKTKTIAVDLSGVFLADDYRVRIVSNMELYWDAAFFSVDEEPAPLSIARLDPVAVDLHYRGFSAIEPGTGNGPERYHYDQVSPAQKWPPMRGRFTRYGDARELLDAEDDRMVVLGSGDEMTIEFALPADDPPPGWTRDFLIYNVGWDKDADLNTIYGQDVEPLPFRAMSGYPYRADESYPDTPLHRAYLESYQTRQQEPWVFWGLVRQYEAR